MAAPYIVSLPDSASFLTRGGVNACVVWADSAADAEVLAAIYNPGTPAVAWAAGTPTAVTAPADLENYRFRIEVVNPTTGAVVVDVTVTGAAAATIDDIGDLLVIALNATAPIANSSYDSGSNVLTVSSIADGIGNMRLLAYAYGPASEVGDTGVSHTEFFSTVVDEGIAGAVLTIVLVAASPPKVYAVGKSYV